MKGLNSRQQLDRENKMKFMKILKNEALCAACSRSACAAGAVLAINKQLVLGATIIIIHLIIIYIAGLINE